MKNNIYLKLGKDWLLNCPIEGRKSFRMTVVIKKNVNEKILKGNYKRLFYLCGRKRCG